MPAPNARLHVRAGMDAEETLDDAEKKLSTALARDGCRKAILAWDLQEKRFVEWKR